MSSEIRLGLRRTAMAATLLREVREAVPYLQRMFQPAQVVVVSMGSVQEPPEELRHIGHVVIKNCPEDKANAIKDEVGEIVKLLHNQQHKSRWPYRRVYFEDPNDVDGLMVDYIQKQSAPRARNTSIVIYERFVGMAALDYQQVLRMENCVKDHISTRQKQRKQLGEQERRAQQRVQRMAKAASSAC